LLIVENLNSGYGKTQVLFDINLKVRDKGITVLIGPNGSGKSTLLKTLMGLTDVYSGKIFLNGEDIIGTPPHTMTRMGVAYLPQVNNVFTDLKVSENLKMAAYTLNNKEAEELVPKIIEDFPIIKQTMEKKAGTLSGGERQMLAMAMAMIKKPNIMLFDEPTGSLAPIIALEVLNKIDELRDEQDMSIIIAEQNAKRALEHGNDAVLLVSGRVNYLGDSNELLNHEELGKIFLGIK
jgi:branched-chain amino acid transport system ATP-binding protein